MLTAMVLKIGVVQLATDPMRVALDAVGGSSIRMNSEDLIEDTLG
jgi:hypothetical protein